jgi:hypothetical protein
MSLDNFIRIEAACGFNGNGSLINARECTVVRNGVGDYSVTLNRSIGLGEGVFPATPQGAVRFCVTSPVSETRIDIFVFDAAGVAADGGCWFMAVRIAP